MLMTLLFIAELKSEIAVVPSARLMSIVTQSLKWQQHIGKTAD